MTIRMTSIRLTTLLSGAFLFLTASFCSNKNHVTDISNPKTMDQMTKQTVYDFKMKSIDGEMTDLSKYKGKVLVIVNVASKCGLTPQYKEIEAFYKSHQDKDVVVLGFPANNFMGQEPGTESEIKTFCSTNYGVTFPMFSKISVKGDDTHPLYQYLTKKSQNGILDAEVTWNFQKFIVNKEGHVVHSFSPKTTVTDPEFLKAIQSLL